METDAKKDKVSPANIVIGSGLLWISYYAVLPAIVRQFVDRNVITGQGNARYATILFFTFAISALIAGVITGSEVDRRPLWNACIVGAVTVAFSLFTMVPVKNLGVQTTLVWIVSVVLPLLIGTIIGMHLKKRRIKK